MVVELRRLCGDHTSDALKRSPEFAPDFASRAAQLSRASIWSPRRGIAAKSSRRGRHPSWRWCFSAHAWRGRAFAQQYLQFSRLLQSRSWRRLGDPVNFLASSRAPGDLFSFTADSASVALTSTEPRPKIVGSLWMVLWRQATHVDVLEPLRFQMTIVLGVKRLKWPRQARAVPVRLWQGEP